MNASVQSDFVPQPQPGFEPARLAAIGHGVRERLALVPSAQKLPTDDADIYLIERFLVGPDCRQIISAINSLAEPSSLYRGTQTPDFRTSHTHHFASGNAHTRELERYICDVTGLDILHAERMQGQRYQKGQQFKHHHDFFHVGQGYWQDEKASGGQRSWTAMLALNEPREGGETDFPLLGLRIPPKQGRLILWDNMDRNGRPNMKTLHAGLPVLRGIKHVVTLWFRQDPWRLLNQ